MDEKHNFTKDELAALRVLAEMFPTPTARNEIRLLAHEGATLQEIITAYKTRKNIISTLKTVGSLIVLAGGVIAVLKGFNFWPK